MHRTERLTSALRGDSGSALLWRDSSVLVTSPFLIVEDDVSIVRVIKRILTAYGEVRAVTSVAGALDAMALHRSWCGLVLDFKLGDGNGLDFLELARTRHPHVPALLVTGTLEPAVVNRAFQLGASYLCKPIESDLMRRFARDARGATEEAPPSDRGDTLPEGTQRAVLEYVRTHRLSPVETLVVEGIVMSVPRTDVMEQRDITTNTYKTHVRHILKKTGETSVSAVRAAVVKLAARSQS